METKENEKLLALTKLIGRKDLSFGCRVITEMEIDGLICSGKYCPDEYYVFSKEKGVSHHQKIKEIIGHTLLLSDILNGLNEKGLCAILRGNELTIYNFPKSYNDTTFILDLSLPLFSQQSEDFKEFIFDTFNIK